MFIHLSTLLQFHNNHCLYFHVSGHDGTTCACSLADQLDYCLEHCGAGLGSHHRHLLLHLQEEVTGIGMYEKWRKTYISFTYTIAAISQVTLLFL